MKSVDRSFAASGMLCAAAMCILMLGAGAVAAPAASPAAKAQPAPPDDPAKVAAAKQFIQLYHPNMDPKNISASIDSYMPRAIEAAKKQDPKLDAKKFAQEKKAHFMDNAARSLDRQAHVVSRHFTLEELKGLIAFYSSPLGRKLTGETRKITMELKLLQAPSAPVKVMVTGDPSSGKVVLSPADPKKK
jgi:hypothetical protein